MGTSRALGGHLALAALTLLPLAVRVPANLNVVATAALCVYVGCWRSLKEAPPQESMTRKDALKFPLIGSAVLLGLFTLFKLLPKDLVNAVLTAYFVVLGTLALTATLLPFLEPAFSARQRTHTYHLLKLTPPFLKEPLEVSFTLVELVGGLLCLPFCCWYYASKHWVANNVLGLAFAIQGIEHLSIGAVATGAILLSGLFFYDIFFVFFTPVMVSVAKSFNAPIKLLFPRHLAEGDKGSPFSMLGLGDIVIPGIFIALLLRFEAKRARRSGIFLSAFWSYVAGLTTTIVVMNVFEAAQPALLYIVPAVLGAVGVHALACGEGKELLAYSEEVRAEVKEELAEVKEAVSTRTKAL